MSTFFHSAAMSLLSRTLQTLLSKYLSDVDVEGVALPSLMTDSGAGWGVRLCNVKLRDGTKLMDLPGKARPAATAATATAAAKRRKQKGETKGRAKGGVQSNSGGVENGESSSAHYPVDRDPSGAGGEANLALRSAKDDEAATLETVATEVETDLDTACGSNIDPPTTAKKRGWLSSWFYGSNEQKPLLREDNDDEEPSNGNSLNENSARNGCVSDSRSAISKNADGDELTKEAACVPPSIVGSASTVDPLVGSVANGVSASFVTYSDEQDDDDDEEVEGDDQQDEDEFDEPLVILRLGKGGTIGTLDVRLVGKTIHVLVEDAFLTVEAVRPAPKAAASSDNNETPTAPSDGGGSKAAATAAATKKAAPPPPDPKTTGDRVLAENAIARIFSAIPNLFLRDIRVRLVIRDEIAVSDENGDEYDGATDEEEVTPEYNSNDTVIELTIELLSVNDGKDFMLNFGGTVDEDDPSSSSEDDSDGARTGDTSGPVSSSMALGVETANEFLTKRIRTGRGPEGGIMLKIYQAGDDLNHFGGNKPVLWAREIWNASTELVVLRCSGLDLQARIFLGTKKEIAISNHGYYAEEFDYEDFTVDAMLFGGVDYIVPGPQPPLPPISSAQATNLTADEAWAKTGAKTFVAGTNGIQSCRLPSPFHKVARGLVPRHCSGAHLPCEWCHRCWTKDAGADRPHALDASTPLGGLVFHISFRDPLEVNVDRYNLAVLGLLLSLFTKKQTGNIDLNEASVEGDLEDVSINAFPNDSQRSTKSLFSKNGSFANSQSFNESSRSIMSLKGRSTRILDPNTVKKYCDYEVESCFPTYMQPEKIQMLGLHLSEIHFRVHVMQQNGESEGGRSYCYWDILGKCVTVDHQQLNARERPFQDLRFDVGHLTVTEFKGVQRKQIVSLGVRQQAVDFDNMTVETFMTVEKNHRRSPWPTTAAAILDVTPPLESLAYADRERHGLQLRYVSVLDPSEGCDRIRKDVNLRVGAAAVDVEFAIKNDIVRVIGEARSSLLGPPKPFASSEDAPKPIDSVMKYKLIADGGRVHMEPFISASLPRTTVEGEISSEAGFSFETLLNQFQVSYGKPSAIRALDRGLSLQQLAKLPDNVRLRVLLFLKDLKPLEAALGLPESSNSFLRCRAVNKGIVNVSKKVARIVARIMASHEPDPTAAHDGRRQELMNELLVLDDNTLAALLDEHRRNERRRSANRF